MIVAWLRKVPVTCNWFDLSCISMARDNPKQWVADSTESTILLTMRAEGVCTVFIVVPTGTLKDAKGYNICHLTDLSILIGRKSSPCNVCWSMASHGTVNQIRWAAKLVTFRWLKYLNGATADGLRLPQKNIRSYALLQSCFPVQRWALWSHPCQLGKR